MSLTCLTCRTVVEPTDERSTGSCPRCGEDLVVSEEAWLEWSGPAGIGRMAVVDGMTIGRLLGNDLVLRHREVSKRHASLHRTGDGWLLQDDDSANGTTVNGHPGSLWQLDDGDRIELGAIQVIFHATAAPPDTAGITIVPQPDGEQSIQACLKCEPGDFVPGGEMTSDEELRSDYERLRLAYRFHRYMASERDQHALLQNILELAFDLVPADRGAILLREDEGSPLIPSVTRHRRDRQGPITIPDTILRRAVKERSAVLSADAMVNLRFKESVSVVSENVRSAMCVPLVGQREVIGAIHLDTQEQTGAFAVKELQLLSVMAGQAAALLERSRLHQRLDREAKARERLRRFLAPEVLREVVDRGLDLQADGRTGLVTVLFCDIRGFTSLAETLPPTTLVKLLNAFFEEMVDVVFDHAGVLDKFIGDALMAVWGAPLKRPTDAHRAVAAGLEMMAAVERLNKAAAEQGWPALQVGVGLNTGEAVIGTVGSSRRMEYTVMGDAVNLAARVCDLARGQQMLITAATLEAAATDGATPPRVRRLPPETVRGRKKAVLVFEVQGLDN